MSAKLRSIKNFGKVIKWKNLALAQILLLSLLTSFTNTSSVNAASCNDVEFIFARGSGEPLNGASYSEWKKEISAQLASSSLTYDFHELGDDKNLPYGYRAVAISGDFRDFVTMVDAYFSAGEAFRFGASVKEGREELRLRVANLSASCPKTKLVLGGYSQGAMIMTTTLSDIVADKIVYVTNFGDPKLYLPEGNRMDGVIPKVPDACSGKKISEYRTYVPDCWAYEGILTAQRPYREEEYAGKVGTWCNKGDFICSSKFNIEDHSHYIADGLYADAAKKVYQKLAKAFPAKFPAREPSKMHNVLFMLDATGSMEDLFKTYRNQLKELAKQIFRAGGSVAAYGYKDSLVERSSWSFCDFSCTEEQFMSSLGYYMSMGGGDPKESLLSALYLSMGELNWQWGATKSIVVVTDDGYHEKDFGGVDLPQVIQRSLEIDPVNIYVLAPEHLADTYAEMTTQTNGKFFGLEPINEENLLTNQATIQSMNQLVFDRPVAKLDVSEYYGLVGDTINFDASESYSFNGKELQYEWDLDGDGVFEPGRTGAKISQTYDATFEGFIQVRVSDGEKSSTMSAQVHIEPQIDALAKIDELNYEKVADGEYEITFQTDAPDVMVSINDAVLGFAKSSDLKTRSAETTFPVKGVTENATILLTPYSVEGRRGVSRSIEIAGDKTIEKDPPSAGDSTGSETEKQPEQGNQPDKDDTITRPTTPSQTLSNSTASSAEKTPAIKPAQLPKAPDTGVYDRRLLPKD